MLPTKAIAEAFGVELGPIIGTNVLRQFLSTLDGPGRCLLLSRRGDPRARAAHLALVGEEAHPIPFFAWASHMMIARGRIGDSADVPLFVDSGLAAATKEGQTAFLAPQSTLREWGALVDTRSGIARIPGSVSMGRASRSSVVAYRVLDREWRNFGDWGGIAVAGLISWGFLKYFAWTIDFDSSSYLLREAPKSPE